MADRWLVDYAILCFTTGEFDALLRRFEEEAYVGVGDARRTYAFRKMRTRDGREATIALVRTVDQGLAEAQSAATDMIEDLQPRCFVVCGIAGGKPGMDVFLGDVVLATRIHDFSQRANTEEGDELATAGYPVHRKVGVLVAALPAMRDELGDWNSEEELIHPRPVVADVELEEVRGSDDWRERVQRAVRYHKDRDRPLFTDGPIGSSDDLVRDENAMRERLEVDRRLLAVEMESAGVAKACDRSEGATPLIVVRAISDIPGLKRGDTYNGYACHVAASFTKALVGLDVVERIDPDSIKQVRSSGVTDLVRIGTSLPDPVPAVVLKRAFGVGHGELEDVAARSAGSVRLDGEAGDYVRFLGEPTGPPGGEPAQSTLYELLNFIESRSATRAGMEQCRNALALFRLLDVTGKMLIAERTFDVLDKPVKSLGNKRLVIEVAEACIEAVSHGSRSRSEAECEARARICGLSWAYQRMGMLDRAAEEADKSLELARLRHSKTNLAFGMKCNGRLARLRAEATEDRDERNRLFEESEKGLQQAAVAFSDHADFGPDHGEVGDCYSLLGRTSLSKGDVKAAQKWVELASERLGERSSKDYLDLLILQGELAVRRGEYAAAYAFFREVLGSRQDGDYQRSEILARAFMERARLYVRLGEVAKGKEDYERAASIWDRYGERESAGKARWEAFAAKHRLSRPILRIWEGEPSFAIRAAASRRYEEGIEGTPTGPLTRINAGTSVG